MVLFRPKNSRAASRINSTLGSPLKVQLPHVGEVAPDGVEAAWNIVGQVQAEETHRLSASPVGVLVRLLIDQSGGKISRLFRDRRAEVVRVVHGANNVDRAMSECAGMSLERGSKAADFNP